MARASGTGAPSMTGHRLLCPACLEAARGRLLCCSGAELPFAANSLQVVVASDVIEHTPRQREFLQSCWRVLAPGGMLFLVVPNRFSLSIEPHVRLWGVGFLPR
jgi:predicted SAM-dependent methyltransferase